MSKKILFSVDVESDLHTGNYSGINIGLNKFEKLCDKYKINPTLFVVGRVLKDNPNIFKRLDRKGWDISCHGYSHKRFDDLSFKEKEKEISECVKLWKKILKHSPKGFRAPQHSIDSQTLDLLNKYGFSYDSSYTPLNIFQLLFFPKRIKQFIKQFFSRVNPYSIRSNLTELPVSSIFIPPVSLIVRLFPKFILYLYFKKLMFIYKKPIFYAHSWDFIEMPKSKIDKMFPHDIFLKKLDYIMSLSNEK